MSNYGNLNINRNKNRNKNSVFSGRAGDCTGLCRKERCFSAIASREGIVYNEKEVSRSKRKNKETKAVKTAGENNEEKRT